MSISDTALTITDKALPEFVQYFLESVNEKLPANYRLEPTPTSYAATRFFCTYVETGSEHAIVTIRRTISMSHVERADDTTTLVFEDNTANTSKTRHYLKLHQIGVRSDGTLRGPFGSTVTIQPLQSMIEQVIDYLVNGKEPTPFDEKEHAEYFATQDANYFANKETYQAPASTF